MNGLPELPVEGGCRCGTVRFLLSGPPWMESVCHCFGCQRMSASAFSTTLTMPSEAFALIGGGTVIGGANGNEADHHHCDHCKSWIFTRPRADLGFVNVRATLLDDVRWFRPWMETQTAERLAWAQTGASLSFQRFPDAKDYPNLIREYRAARGWT